MTEQAINSEVTKKQKIMYKFVEHLHSFYSLFFVVLQ